MFITIVVFAIYSVVFTTDKVLHNKSLETNELMN